MRERVLFLIQSVSSHFDPEYFGEARHYPPLQRQRLPGFVGHASRFDEIRARNYFARPTPL